MESSFQLCFADIFSDVQWTVSQTGIQSTWYLKKKNSCFLILFKNGKLKKKFVLPEFKFKIVAIGYF